MEVLSIKKGKIKAEEAFEMPVYKTEDYSIFSKLSGNRDLNRNHVRRLVKVVATNPAFTEKNPLVVNDDMQVIDGQHRLAAFEFVLEKEGMAYPVYYVVKSGARLSDARNLNIGSLPWGPRDYARAYAMDGNPHYKTYLRYVEKYPAIAHKVIARALGGQKDAAIVEFKHGMFQVVDEKWGDKFLQSLMEADAIAVTGPRETFALAFMRVYTHPRYDHQRMLEQLEANKIEIMTVPQSQSHLAVALNTAYNMGHRDKVDLLIRS